VLSNLAFWKAAHYDLPLAILVLSTLVIAIFNISYGFLQSNLQKREMKTLFGQYVPPAHVDQILMNSQMAGMEGESRHMTVLFSDIRSFTTISEGLKANRLKQLLNDFFTPITGVIFEHNGTIDKYVGDMVMAFWNAPLADENHAEHAIDAAMAMQRTADALLPVFAARHLPEVHIGIGINTGFMNVGDMGSQYRRTYTVIGDAVNLGSRLEGLTKFYGVKILVGEGTYDLAPNYLYRLVDKIIVKGKREPVCVYEPVCRVEDASDSRRARIESYNRALDHYYSREWDQAEQILRDLHAADPDRVLNELTVKQVVPEEWGGDTPVAKVSAHTGQGIDELLEIILIQAELLELTAVEEGTAQGVVIEARVEKGRGAVASVLVQKGTLRTGDLVLAGQHYGRVRAMIDENGKQTKSAGPSIPVEILGLPEAPNAGDEFMVVDDERKAREVAEFRANKERQAKMELHQGMKLENLFATMGKQEVPSVNIVLKTDVRGSLEALTQALNDLSVADVRVKIVSSGVGAITESDVSLAESTGAVILGFNVRADNAARQKCQQDDIDLRYYSVIYEMIDDVKAAMSGLLSPEHREHILGVAQVRDVFRSSRFGAAAGCMVLEGIAYRNKPIRVLRDEVVVFQGELESLRRFKDDVHEVRNGMECGMAVKGYNDIRPGDKIEIYEVHEIKRTL